MDRRIDLVGSLVVTGFGLLAVVMAYLLPHPRTVYDFIGPAGLPTLLGLSMVGLGAVQSWRTARLMRETGPYGYPEGAEDEPDHPSSTMRAVAFIGGGIAYVVSLPSIGYLVATPVAIAIGLWLLRYRSLWRVAAIALGYTLIAFIVFDRLLSVPLPLGVLNGLLVDLGIVERVR